MGRRVAIRTAALSGVLVMFTISARAQFEASEPERWHLTGSAGFDLSGSSQRVSPSQIGTSQLFPLGDLRLNTDGFLLDPKFLHVNGSFSFQKGANTSNQISIDNGGWAFAVTAAFLPRSHFPLRVTYAQTRFGVNGFGLTEDSDNSRLDVQWLALVPNWPRLSLGLQRYSNDVQVQHTFADRSFRETGANLGLADDWRGWQWSANAAVDEGSTTQVAGENLAAPFNDSSRIGSFNLWRSLWNDKARLTFENREIWRHDSLDASGSSDSREFTDTLRFDEELTPQLTLTLGYGFAQERFNSANIANLFPGIGPTQLIGLLSSTSHSVSGAVKYRVTGWLHVGQDVRYSHSTPAPGVAESRLSLTDTQTTIGATHRWHGLDMSLEYAGRFQMVGTTLERSATSWSNGVNTRVAWGSVRSVRFTGAYEQTRLNLAEQIGGFTRQRRIRGEAETARFAAFRLRATVEQDEIDILNFNGNTETSATSYGAAAEHRLFSVTYANSVGSGAGALFPPLLVERNVLIIPLPIAQLVGTPLLNRDSRANSLIVQAHPASRLEATFLWRREHNLLFSSRQDFDTLQASARYRLGRMLFEAGYSNNAIAVFGFGSLSGEHLRRWYFRIARDFKVF